MKLTDILIILGCLAAGYWIVSSVMSPGTGNDKKPSSNDPPPRAPEQPRLPTPPIRSTASRGANEEWTLVLDVPRSATRSDIDAAFKRRLAQAQAANDTMEVERVRRAHAAALAQRGI
jgi:hypothetical protein